MRFDWLQHVTCNTKESRYDNSSTHVTTLCDARVIMSCHTRQLIPQRGVWHVACGVLQACAAGLSPIYTEEAIKQRKPLGIERDNGS